MSIYASNCQEAVSERLHNVHGICRSQFGSFIQCKRCDLFCSIMISEVAIRPTEERHSSQFHSVLSMARSMRNSRTKVSRCHDERTQLHERPSHFYGTNCSKACACHGPYASQQRGCWLSKYGLKSLARLSVSFVVSNRLPPTFTGTMAAALLAGAPSTQQLQLTRFVILRNGCDECAASTVCGFGGVRLMLDKAGQGT